MERHLPGRSTTTVDEANALAWARLAQAHCRFEEGHRLAVAWAARMRREKAVRSRIRWNLVAVGFELLGGEQRAAARTLLETLTLAAKGDFLASFLDEPLVVDFCVTQGIEATEGLDSEVSVFVERIYAARNDAASQPPSRAEGGPASLASLSPREIDVLTLAAAAWRNRDIADRLGLTEGTVKWYLQQVYDKLGVRKRSLAVDRARRFGLIGTGS